MSRENSSKILIGTTYTQLIKAKFTGKMNLKNIKLLSIIDSFKNTCNINENTKDILEKLSRKIQNKNKEICQNKEKVDNRYFELKEDRINNFFKNIKDFKDNKLFNSPPTIVGDGNKLITNKITTLTVEDFTTNTDPSYFDPENDDAYLLKIKSLPVYGTLKLNNLEIIVNQIIKFSDIKSGLLTFTFNNNNNIDFDTLEFDFSIADSGSLNFTE